MTIIVALLIFIIIIEYIIIADIILSWLTLFGLNFRPKIIADIIDPLYKQIRSIIPTTIGPVDITAIIVLIFLMFLRGAIVISFPHSAITLNQIIK